ncbi:MAG: hypothetical protein DMF61_02815 [Blastocatellia bacterium AA13]|nr:MAG: hypothetical protein DMF61_02815 [Blastocatellia bacterium AA13]
MDFIDLRSDTVTRPTDEMREAMARAQVGDDVFEEDPTVNRLQELAAAMLGKEAAIFVPTGTMGNQICIRMHTQIGQEVILEERSHIFNMEVSAMAAVSGTLARPVRGEDGVLDWNTIEPAIRQGNPHVADTGLITIENTLNLAGGIVIRIEAMEEICERAHALGLPVHLDGARIFNAATALRRDVSDLARPFDTVMFCLSKGLAAPVGSIVAGPKDFIRQARKVRRMLGGGMRQSGILAAAGIVALEKMVSRIEEDHSNAQLLAKGLAQLSGIRLDPERVATNILVFEVNGSINAKELQNRLKERGVLAIALNDKQMRMVTHKDVSRADCERAVSAAQAALPD